MNKHVVRILPLFLVACAAAAMPPAATAQYDPPSRVARLSYVSGAVSLQPAGVDEWASANSNRPLTIGDRLWTDQRARAELHLGNAAIRLGSETSFSFLNLDDNAVQMQLNQGTLNIRLRQLGESEAIEVDTPNLAFSLLRPGEYRVDVSPDGNTTTVVVRSGEGEAIAGGQAYTIHPRERATFSGMDSLSYDLSPAPHPDHFDDWGRSRDEREDRPRRHEYVSSQMVGYQDLDDYGTWRVVSGYGPVWTPIGVAPGWAPYRYGHWAWIEPWGWTWVDDAPWGFAPFHYGRWAWVGNGWVWVPGALVARPVYAPALVVFVGGNRFNMALSFGGGGGVGWFPLAPGEPYIPAYRSTPAYIRNVNNTTNVTNITNVTNVTNITYVNRTVPGAVTAVPTQTMTNASPVATSAVKVSPTALQTVQVVQAAPVAPVQKSVLGGNAGNAVQPPPATVNRTVVAKAPPPPPPVPFAAKQQALAANPGRPLDSGAVENLRRSQGGQQQQIVRPAGPTLKANPTVPPTGPVVTKPPTGPATLPPSNQPPPPPTGRTQTTPVKPTPTAPVNPPPSNQPPPPPPTGRTQTPPVKPPQPIQPQQQQQEELKKKQELERQRQEQLRLQEEKQRQQQEELKKQQELERQRQERLQQQEKQRQQQEELKKQQDKQRKDQAEKDKKSKEQKDKEKTQPKPPGAFAS